MDISTEVPPKSKRKLQLEAARARKVVKLDESYERRDMKAPMRLQLLKGEKQQTTTLEMK